MLSKKFFKAALCTLLALSITAYSVPSFSYTQPTQERTTISLKSDWNRNAAQNLYKVKLARRRDTNFIQKEAKQTDEAKVWARFIDHLIQREGKRNMVYKDSLGKPTVGVGHLVQKGDNLKVGERISDAKVREFLEKDASKAFNAAKMQAGELGINDADFIIALGSVNFQLGTSWRSKFPNTWRHIVNGNYAQAIKNIERSLWAKQTPVRTKDFVNAIKQVANQASAAKEITLAQSSDISTAQQIPILKAA